MINRKDDIRETVPSLAPYRKCARFLPIEVSLSHVSSQPDQYFIRGCPDRALTAIVFRDSFFSDLEPFFSENCKQIICLWKDYDQNNIEEILARVKPDIVFEIKAERHFFRYCDQPAGVYPDSAVSDPRQQRTKEQARPCPTQHPNGFLT